MVCSPNPKEKFDVFCHIYAMSRCMQDTFARARSCRAKRARDDRIVCIQCHAMNVHNLIDNVSAHYQFFNICG